MDRDKKATKGNKDPKKRTDKMRANDEKSGRKRGGGKLKNPLEEREERKHEKEPKKRENNQKRGREGETRATNRREKGREAKEGKRRLKKSREGKMRCKMVCKTLSYFLIFNFFLIFLIFGGIFSFFSL